MGRVAGSVTGFALGFALGSDAWDAIARSHTRSQQGQNHFRKQFSRRFFLGLRLGQKSIALVGGGRWGRSLDAGASGNQAIALAEILSRVRSVVGRGRWGQGSGLGSENRVQHLSLHTQLGSVARMQAWYRIQPAH